MTTFTTKTETYKLYEPSLIRIQDAVARMYGDMGGKTTTATTGQLWPRGNW